MDKTSVENLTVQEIKELIDNEIIALEKLDNTALEKIMNHEIDMLCFGSGDMMIIRRCSEILNERNDSENMSKERIISIIDKTKKEHVVIVDEENRNNPKVIKRHNIVLRRIGLVAAIITLILATTTIVAAAFGVNIFEYLSNVVRQDEGAEVDVDGFTFYHNGEAKQYSSIEELIKQENLDIMYPTKWPEGVYIDSIRMTQVINGNTAIQIYTSNINVGINIELSTDVLNSDIENIFEHNGIKYYIEEREVYYSYCYFENNKYYITANTKEDLLLIINNMEK